MPRSGTSAASPRGRRRSSWRQHYRERRMMAVVFTVDSESVTGQARVPNEEIAEVARANADVLIPFASIDPHKGRRGVERGAPPDRRPRRPRLQVPPQRARVLPERPSCLSALRGDRGGGPPGAVPQRSLGRRLGAPRGRRHPPQVLQPDARRRRRRGLPGPQDRPRPPVVPLAGRGHLDRTAQAAGLHRPLRVVAEVLSAAARPLREHAAAEPGALRHRLPVHHSRALARRLRPAGHPARGAPADPEGERRSACSGSLRLPRTIPRR